MALLPPLRGVDLQTLLETPPPVQPYYVTGGAIPKRAKVIFGGEKKVGKSFVAFGLARALALGGVNLFDIPEFFVPEPVVVGYVEAEVGPWSMAARGSLIFQGDPIEEIKGRLITVAGQREFRLDVPGAVEQARDFVLGHGINVLILDPIGKMHGLDGSDEQDITKLMAILDRIRDACTATDLTIVYAQHFGKKSKDPRSLYDPLDPDNFIGSHRWTADPDTLIMAHRRNIEGTSRKWYLDTRWIFRHAEPLPDQTLIFNERGDLRVSRFEREVFSPVTV